MRIRLILVMFGLLLIIGMLLILPTKEYGHARLERSRAFLLVPGVMQTVQPEFWGAIVVLQSFI